MPIPAGAAFVLRDVTVTFDGDDFGFTFDKAVLVPDTPIQTLKTFQGGVVQDIDTTSWTLELSGYQDWTDAQGFADYLNANAGDQVEVIMTLKNGGRSATCTVTLIPVNFGGQRGEFGMVEVTLPVSDQPDFG